MEWLGFSLAALAAVATVAGGFIGVHRRARRPGYLSVALGFAAGAMLTLTVLELVPVTYEVALSQYGSLGGAVAAVVVVALGVLLTPLVHYFNRYAKILWRLVPALERTKSSRADTVVVGRTLLQSGMIVALIIGAHNIPEGMATYASALHSVSLGILVAFVIALHNIPEGVAIAAPVYKATSRRRLAMKYVIIAAAMEPLGAVLGWLVLSGSDPSPVVLGVVFGITAGMMTYISLRELLPAAREHSVHVKQPLVGAAVGALVITVSIVATWLM